jgi:hypothetical protein
MTTDQPIERDDADEQPPEKPYVLVSFAAPKPSRAAPAGHHALGRETLTGVAVLTLTARRPVQVAGGGFDVIDTREGPQIVAMDSRIRRYAQDGATPALSVLPGSSLKGALRSLVEAVAPACVMVGGWPTRSALPSDIGRCNRRDQLCPACRMFGMSGAGRDNYQGQISVEDARVLEGAGGRAIVRVPLLWQPARGRGQLPLRYLNRARNVYGRKVYRHSKLARGPDARLALRTDTRLEARLHFENLAPAELGLLAAALGMHPRYPFLPKIGAGKPIGMGSVAAGFERVTLYGAVARAGRLGAGELLEGEPLAAQIQTWIDAATQAGLLIEDALTTVYATLRAENLERAPLEGAY